MTAKKVLKKPIEGRLRLLFDSSKEENFDDGVSHLLENFGLNQLSVENAAFLFAESLWFSGRFPEIIMFDNENSPDDCPDKSVLWPLLKDKAETIEEGILYAINKELIKPTLLRKNFDGNLNAKLTYVNVDEVAEWLHSLGFETGEHLSEWSIDEIKLSARLGNLVDEDRMDLSFYSGSSDAKIDRERAEFINTTSNFDLENYKELASNLFEKNARLTRLLGDFKTGKTEQSENPLAPKERRTLQRVIAALCTKCNIDLTGNAFTKEIVFLTESLDLAVTDDTIRNMVRNMPGEIRDATKKKPK